MIQRDLHAALRTDLLANHARIATLARALGADQLARRPESGGWSVGEVLEHLCVSDEIYGPERTRLVRSARADAAAPLRPWRPTLFGRMMAYVLANPRKVRTLKKFEPGPTPRAGVVEEFLARDTAVLAQMDDAAQLDWRALRLRAAIPLPLHYNLGDVFRIHVIHVGRHLAQMERVVRSIS